MAGDELRAATEALRAATEALRARTAQAQALRRRARELIAEARYLETVDVPELRARVTALSAEVGADRREGTSKS